MKRTLLLVAHSLFAISCFADPWPKNLPLDSGWKLQDAPGVKAKAVEISSAGFRDKDWHAATVPGTVLTSLVNDYVYPEPLYGENNRPDKISEALCRQSYWYRTTFTVPPDYKGKKVWLNFDGINYSAEIWLNGKRIGDMRGAFARGQFDVTDSVSPGKKSTLAVLIAPQPHPGWPHEHTLADGMGLNGGMTAVDGPTFLCTIGWDWIPAIRDRDSGIWQGVYLSATGPVAIKNPLITTDLPLPDLSSADIAIQTTLENNSAAPQHGVLKGGFGDVTFDTPVDIPAHASKLISLDPKSIPALHVRNPSLWWPNGFGPQNLYKLSLNFEAGGKISDHSETMFGIRKITYSVPDSENLTVSVNGVRLLCKGGNWGMDEAMKRIPRERLEAQVRMHQVANYTIIRNWVGQSTSEDFYDMCDKYGLLLWDEFFQPNPSDGPDPTDLTTYVANVRDKILRFRNHPSIAIWCARNEGYPPKEIDDELRKLMSDLEPTRLYQASSTAGRGVYSHGPYCWRTPREYYDFETNDIFKTETGSMSVPTLESVQGMMPQKDWEVINDDWAEHDFAHGAQHGDEYPKIVAERYGKVKNLADFVRKAQMMDYEAYRAMYEGRNAKLFKPSTGVITWMSNPAQPSFTWQLYHYDLEPCASFFGAKKACEPLHIQLNEKTSEIEVINNLPKELAGAKGHVAIYNLGGEIQMNRDFDVHVPATAEAGFDKLEWASNFSPVHFVRLTLTDGAGKLLSENVYWRGTKEKPDDLQSLDTMAKASLEFEGVRHDLGDKTFIDVTLHNRGSQVALMTHLQLRQNATGKRVLPVYYSDNYATLFPGETKTISMEAARSALEGGKALVAVDGWNVACVPFDSTDVAVKLNENSQVSHWPVTGLPMEVYLRASPYWP